MSGEYWLVRRWKTRTLPCPGKIQPRADITGMLTMHAEEYDILDFSSRVLGSGLLPPAGLDPFGLFLQPKAMSLE